MHAVHSRLDRPVSWIDREHAKDDEIAKLRPTWWQAAKLVAGTGAVV
jgi:hypothetical protein